MHVKTTWSCVEREDGEDGEDHRYGADGYCFVAAYAVSTSVLVVTHDRSKSKLPNHKGIYPF